MAAESDDVDDLVAQAILATRAGGGAAVDALCAQHPSHAREIRARLSRLRRAGLLEPEASAPAAPLPDRIGRYRILAELGRGGMGVVYRAEQREPVRREVALKVIRAGMDTQDVLARFALERETLARLQHPHIAQLLDAGQTPDGRPFLVMELVEGRDLTAFCREPALGLRARLGLFAVVCDAVQHAHHKGVVHRDLKPGNILVEALPDGTAVPKIVDFGIVKLLDPRHAGRPQTSAVTLLGTPEYMSPEQAALRSDLIDTRSDVYALGVILYELVAGSLPHDPDRLRACSPGELVRLLETPPRAPSASAGATPWPDRGPLARRELDWIVLRALAAEPERRYPSATALATDVRRLLRAEPVEAAPPSVLYRLRKNAQRHRAAFAVAVAVLFGFVASTLLYLDSRQAKITAQERAAEAETVAEFLERLFDGINPGRGGRHDVPARAVVARGADRVRVTFADRPALRARLLARIGRAQLALGDDEPGERALRDAIAIWRSAGTPTAELLEAELALTDLLARRGRTAEADPDFRRIERDAELLGDRRLRGFALCLRGWWQARAGDGAAGEVLVREAVSLLRTAEAPHELVDALSRLGGTLHDSGRHAEAAPALEEAVAIATADAALGPAWSCEPRNNLARVYVALDRPVDALAEIDAGLADAGRLFGTEHRLYAALLVSKAEVLLAGGGAAGAEAALRTAVAICERVLAPDEPDIAWARNDLAMLLHSTGRSAEARDVLADAIAGLAEDGHPFAVTLHANLADVLAALGDLASAETEARRAVSVADRLGQPAHVVATAERRLADVLHRHGLTQESDAALARAIAALEHAAPTPVTAAEAALCAITAAYFANLRGDREAAALRATEAIEHCERAGHRNEVDANAHFQLGWARSGQGRRRDAITELRIAVELYRAVLPEGSWLAAYAFDLLGQELARDGDAAAIGPLREAFEMRQRLRGPDDALVKRSLSSLAVALLRFGDREGARATAADALRRYGADPRDADAARASLLSVAATVAEEDGNFAAALDHLRACRADQERLGAAPSELARIDLRVGRALAALHRWREAEQALLAAHAAADDATRAGARAQLTALYAATGRPEEAARWR